MVEFEKMYRQAITVSHNLVDDIRFSRDIHLDAVKECSTQICEYLTENTNILAMLNTVKEEDPYLYSHPVHVAFTSFIIGKWINLKKSELPKLVFTGMVHDIGKAKIGDKILNKPDKLTDHEIEIVRNHPVSGYKILTSLDIHDSDILSGVISHHERQDGTGYPKGLKGDEIGLFGKIIAIADIYDAMTSKKPYRLKNTPFKAVEEIWQSSFGSLDPMVSQAFLKNIFDFYFGSKVRLSDERIGEIVYVNPEEKTRPLVRCEDEFINLAQQRNVEIVEMI